MDINKVREFLESYSYVLHSGEIDGYYGTIDVSCPKGHRRKVKYGNLRRSLRNGRTGCMKCKQTEWNPNYKGKNREEHRRVMKEELFFQIELEGYAVLNTEKQYKNNQTEFKVRCDKKHEPFNTTKNMWDLGKRCKQCFRERISKSFDEIEKELTTEGCELVEWNGSTEKMLYICECGTKHRQLIGDWREGHRCYSCGANKAKETVRKNKLKELDREFAED